MNKLREAVHEYLNLRRGLGFKMQEAGKGLLDFATFMEQNRATYVTNELALVWAQRPLSVQPANWAKRLGHVRGFARHRVATDPRTQNSTAGPAAVPTKARAAISILEGGDPRLTSRSSQNTPSP